tara:strand:- start:246 stop:611 length:366 start_codon:yes stop_codon:yes gene_type:complete
MNFSEILNLEPEKQSKVDGEKLLDPVSPDHYSNKNIQPINVIWDWGLNFDLGNVVKYISRHKDKGGDGDLEKALFYLLHDLVLKGIDVDETLAKVRSINGFINVDGDIDLPSSRMVMQTPV